MQKGLKWNQQPTIVIVDNYVLNSNETKMKSKNL